jgi:putative ABC transport system permease protein
MMSSIFQDIRYAARTLGRSRGFLIVVVVTLSVGIGVNTALFSIVNAVLIRPLGYADPERQFLLYEVFPEVSNERMPFSAPDFDDLRGYQQSIERLAAYRSIPFEISGSGAPERVSGAQVSAEIFEVLGVSPIVGRTFSSEEDRPGVNVAVLSWGLWQRRFAANTDIIGQSIQLDRQPYTVVGVMSQGFVFPRPGPQFNNQPADVWVPMAFTDRERADRGNMQVNSVVGKLKNGVSIQEARSDLEIAAERIRANYPPVLRATSSLRLLAEPLHEGISGRFETPLLLLLAAVGLVLLVACANVANLILSRTAGRAREFAIRAALGARKAKLVQLLLCEALLVSLIAGAIGVAIAYWTVNAVPAVMAQTIPGLQDVMIDFRVLVFTGALSVATAVAFALIPLVVMDRRSLSDLLQAGGTRTTSGSMGLRVQRGLVVITVALAFVLLVGAGLFLRSFASLVSTDVGFRSAHVTTASVSLPRTFYATAASVRTFHESLLASLSSLPGVRSAALATDLPLTRYEFRAFIPERGRVPEGIRPTTNVTWVHGPYFETLGITLKRGRFFTPVEYGENRAVVVVNEKLADTFWPGEDPIGRRLKWGVAESKTPWLVIVGVVANVADGPIGDEPGMHTYEPFRQFSDFLLDAAVSQFGRDVKAIVLAERDDRAFASAIRGEIMKIDPQLAVQNVERMEETVSTVLAPRRFSLMLINAFAGLALLLASVGLYGLLALQVAERRREIGVRLALGAGRRSIIAMVVKQGARLVALGLLAGLVGSLVLSRFVESLLYGTSRLDPVTFLAAPAVLALTAFIACLLPAWRASRVEPSTALRLE